jgi:hypothetical protein
MVKAIYVDNSDVADQATDLGDGVRRDFEVVLTDRIANVAGTVSDRNGRVVSNYTVVVFPEDRDRWSPPCDWYEACGRFKMRRFGSKRYRRPTISRLRLNHSPRVRGLIPTCSHACIRWPFVSALAKQRTLPLKLSPTPEGLLAALKLEDLLFSLSALRHSHD